MNTPLLQEHKILWCGWLQRMVISLEALLPYFGFFKRAEMLSFHMIWNLWVPLRISLKGLEDSYYRLLM